MNTENSNKYYFVTIQNMNLSTEAWQLSLEYHNANFFVLWKKFGIVLFGSKGM